MSVRLCSLMMLTEFSASLLVFCLIVPPTFERGMLKSSAMIVDLSPSPFSSTSFCFRYFVALCLAHTHPRLPWSTGGLTLLLLCHATLCLWLVCSQVHLIYYQYSYSCSLLINVRIIHLLLSFHFQLTYIIFEVSFLQTAYSWILFFNLLG